MKSFMLLFLYILSSTTTIDGLLEGHHVPSTQDLINMLNQMNSTLQLSNQKLQTEYAAMAKNNTEKILTLQTELSNVKKNYTEKILTLESELTNVKTELSSVKSKTLHSPVAFLATLTRTTAPLGIHQTIPYDRVVTNLQHGYDTRHSHFVAPLKGLYQFSVTLMLTASSWGNVEFVMNGNVVFNVHSEGKNGYETGSATGSFSLNAGDMVWVRFSDGDVKTLYGDNYNHFSGFLVQALQ